MKILAVLLFVCLLALMMAPAGALSMGSAGASKTIVTVTTTPAPQISKIPGATAPVTLVTQQGFGLIEVSSVPSGATVIVDGTVPGYASDITPAKINRPAGSHTVRISLSGYKTYTESFYLSSGGTRKINANLQKSLSGVSRDYTENTSNKVVGPGYPITLTRTLVPSTAPIVVNFDSAPKGATVTIDNGAVPAGTTPLQKSLPPGSHNVTIRLTENGVYFKMFTLTAGMAPQYIFADFTQYPDIGTPPTTPCPDTSWSCLAQAEARQQFGPGYAVYSQIPCGYAMVNNQTCYNETYCVRYCARSFGTELSGGGTGVTPGTANTPGTTGTPAAGDAARSGNANGAGTAAIVTPMACPNSDWTCLTPAEAAQQFGYPNARYGDVPCGYAQENSQSVNQYCFMDVDSGGSLSQSALLRGSISNGDDIFIINETWIAHGVVKKSPGTESGGPLQSIFSFFNGILAGSSKPECRLDIVGFNPQPEPPGKGAPGVLIDPQSRLERIGLNPQPEPPALDPQVQNAR